MKIILPIAVLLIAFSCLTEDSADPGKASTFIRYFNGGFDDQAQAFDETPDKGFIILATTQITDNNVTVQRSKIKLIKTDRYGNIEWQTLYPAFGSLPFDPSYYKGRGILVEKDIERIVTGYTIVGDSINQNTGVSYLYILQTDANGSHDPAINKSKSLVLDLNGISLANIEGQSITKASNGNYLVLGSRKNSSEDMILAEINKDDLSLEWLQDYGAGGATNVTGLITHSNTIYWGGTVNRGTNTDIRFVLTTSNSATAIDPLNVPDFNEEIGGIYFSAFGPRFHIVGTTDENGSKDILYRQVSIEGGELQFQDGTKRKIIGNDATPEEGNAICTTSDGGLLIIGTTGLDDDKDYYLIKLNFLGEVVWSRIFGSDKADKGVSIMQSSDGSYVILGATNLGGLGSIMLMKTDSKGNIE